MTLRSYTFFSHCISDRGLEQGEGDLASNCNVLFLI